MSLPSNESRPRALPYHLQVLQHPKCESDTFGLTALSLPHLASFTASQSCSYDIDDQPRTEIMHKDGYS
jgi:hypothetical protein